MDRSLCGSAKQPRRGAAGQPAAMGRAIEAIHASLAADAAAPLSVPAVAAAAGLSQRGLERAFLRALGLSPRDYVVHLRFEAVRRTLASGQAASVLEAAVRHGFGHPGRFAAAYARRFGEAPSATLRGARAARPGPQSRPSQGLVMLRPLAGTDMRAARRATDALAAALCRSHALALAADEGRGVDPRTLYRLQGTLEPNGVSLQLVHPARGIVLATWRETLRTRERIDWASRAVAAAAGAVATDTADRARRTPRHLADSETLVARARAVGLIPDRDTAFMVLDLLGEALERDPGNAFAHGFLATCLGHCANHAFIAEPDQARERALSHARRALLLNADDAEVLAITAHALSLTRRLDEAEALAHRSLALDPNQPFVWRRLGFIENFRGNGPVAVERFKRAYHAWPHGAGGLHTLFGLGVATFMVGDYGRSARLLARVLQRNPSHVWQNRFLTAAAMHAGAATEARRSLTTLRHAYPDLTVDRLRRSGVLAPEALERLLSGLARAGLPAG
ncbi:helix-turn-helix domain-containing protein [Elioraea rosea]|uniref:helix-turn-helix domain-containing protein n=1 Tax=Elioraea rosea TaxID=2492390 RepID=UPI0011836CCB|nr:helix-turn-helix domain-containing protein [Elioraea rosea]